ncbi:nucleotidyltransferase family protein [Temperatibacter marinus]|uniref:Nucleotidyltransferase family protein n=1 Tax=Temperatibacter marinus TaxID=1456591 RepID=A0AA52EF99_9PROT|nr:nucleotidyltransferase family protein [Temperatibacter marinus]WND02593.1 nucleotidyltransferase family protein [Temperatibacter marinus]
MKMKEYLEFTRGKKSLQGNAGRSGFIKWAKKHHLLGRIAHEQQDMLAQERSSEFDQILREIIEDQRVVSSGDVRRTSFEINRLHRLLLKEEGKIILLKGSAYIMAGKKAARGRRVTDVDLLVPKPQLAALERFMLQNDWGYDSTTDNPYDQVYYRTYMHELPPLRHKTRKSVLDIHHALLPLTHRFSIKIDPMIETAVPIEGTPFFRFADVDLFIHAAVHHMLDEEGDNFGRSLVELLDLFDDLDCSLDLVIARAAEVGASKAVAYALSAIYAITEDSRLESSLSFIKKHTSSLVSKAFLDQLALEPKGISKLFLYCRSHYLRMPLGMLAAHLFTKAKKDFMIKFKYYKNAWGRS